MAALNPLQQQGRLGHSVLVQIEMLKEMKLKDVSRLGRALLNRALLLPVTQKLMREVYRGEKVDDESY